jgi:hypothetical protein
MQNSRKTTTAYIPLLSTFLSRGSIKLANNKLDSLADVGDNYHCNPDIEQSDTFISAGGENIPGRFILAGSFVTIAKPEIAKGSILKRFSLSCLRFQRINQDKKRSYFAGTAAENEDNY